MEKRIQRHRLGFNSSRALLRKLRLLFMPSLATRQNQPGQEEGKPVPNLAMVVEVVAWLDGLSPPFFPFPFPFFHFLKAFLNH